MNTSFLSALPAAPSPNEFPQPRPTREAKPAVGSRTPVEEASTGESQESGDSDKADAFAEMLAAMMGVVTPAPDTVVSTEQPMAVETSSAAVTDVPRDGAGAPLFSSTFTTSSSADVTGDASTTMAFTAEATPVLEQTPTSAPAERTAIPEAAAAEIADISAEAAPADIPEPLPVETSESIEAPETISVESTSEPTTTDLVEASLVEVRAVDTAEPVAEQRSPELRVQTTSGEPSATVETRDVSQVESQPTVNEPSPVREAVASPTPQPRAEETAPRVESRTIDQAPTVDEVIETPEATVAVGENAVDGLTDPEKPLEAARNAEREADGQAPKPAASRSAAPPKSEPASGPVDPEVVTSAPVERAAAAGTTGVAPTAKPNAVTRKPAAKEAAGEEKAATAVNDVMTTGATAETSANSPFAKAMSAATAGPHDSSSASTPVHVSQQVMQALAAYEAELPADGMRSFEMILDPPELGRLIVQMSKSSKGVDVRIAAENETVRSILETTGQELQQGLQLSGFDLGQFSGSSSGTFSNGEEFVFAPTLQSFTGSAPAATATARTAAASKSAVDVVV